jgi:enoyl-CoA hydratase/carnithine racemase
VKPKDQTPELSQEKKMSETELPVLYEKIKGVGRLTLNRPDVINAINKPMRAEMRRLLTEADGDPEVRVILITGAGERGFCAGADLKQMRQPESPAIGRRRRSEESWAPPFDQARKPIVAAVHGFCFGGGLEMALACDIRVAATNARFAFMEVKRGIITGAGGSQRLPRVVGLGRALKMMLTAEPIDAQEAYRIGLVSDVFPVETMLEQAMQIAGRMAALPPLALEAAKEAMRKGTELPLAAGIRLELDLNTVLVTTDDHGEAIAAFKEKRDGKFAGR